jgi:hypothetical protein
MYFSAKNLTPRNESATVKNQKFEAGVLGSVFVYKKGILLNSRKKTGIVLVFVLTFALFLVS